MRYVKKDTILKEARAKDKMIDALYHKRMTRDGATKIAKKHPGAFVVIEEEGYVPCRWTP